MDIVRYRHLEVWEKTRAWYQLFHRAKQSKEIWWEIARISSNWKKAKVPECQEDRTARVTSWSILSARFRMINNLIWSLLVGWECYHERTNPRSVGQLGVSPFRTTHFPTRTLSASPASHSPSCRPKMLAISGRQLTQRVSSSNYVILDRAKRDDRSVVRGRVSECPCFRGSRVEFSGDPTMFGVCVIRRFHWGKKRSNRIIFVLNINEYVVIHVYVKILS